LAIAYYAGGGKGKWALWQFCPTTEESLKNALSSPVADASAHSFHAFYLFALPSWDFW
jgi:hypothetical protein